MNGRDFATADIEKRDILGLYKEEKQKYGEFKNVLLTDTEYHKLEQSNLLPYIENLSQYIASKGKKYKSHYATILTWARNDPKNKKLPNWFNKEIENSGELEDVRDEEEMNEKDDDGESEEDY